MFISCGKPACENSSTQDVLLTRPQFDNLRVYVEMLIKKVAKPINTSVGNGATRGLSFRSMPQKRLSSATRLLGDTEDENVLLMR